MKAVVYEGTRRVGVHEVEDATLEDPADVVVRVTSSAVSLVKPGDRVVIPTHLYCGMCFNCVRGYTAACLRVRPGGFGAAYGYAGLGPYRGRPGRAAAGAVRGRQLHPGAGFATGRARR